MGVSQGQGDSQERTAQEMLFGRSASHTILVTWHMISLNVYHLVASGGDHGASKTGFASQRLDRLAAPALNCDARCLVLRGGRHT